MNQPTYPSKLEDEQELAQQAGLNSHAKKMPLTEEGGTPIEESDLSMDELSEIYIPDDGESDKDE